MTLKKTVIIISFLLGLEVLTFGSKLAVLERNFGGPDIVVTDQYIYIWDRLTFLIDIYCKKDFRYYSSFGGKGEGPTEFRFINTFEVLDNSIFVYGFDKIAWFSKEGKFIKEQRAPFHGIFSPVKNRYLSKTYPVSKDITIGLIKYVLTDSSFKIAKELYSTQFEPYQIKRNNKWEQLLIKDKIKCKVYGDRIYIGDTTRGFCFHVFDYQGRKLFEIKRAFEKIAVGKEEKQAYKNQWIGWNEKEYARRFRFRVPEYFPAFVDFRITGDKIYVLKYVRNPLNAVMQDVLILNLEGKLLKKTKVNYSPAMAYDIHDDNYYFIIDNVETEEWELHVEAIK